MDKKLSEIAVDYFLNQGFSCSESIVMAASDLELIPKDYVNIATPYSGGMASGCLCGAISGAQIVIGYNHGKFKTNQGRVLGKKLIEEFKKYHKTTCCKALTAGFKDFHSKERKLHCVNMVESTAKILVEILEEAKAEL